jgi:hypothetical protein
MGKLPQTGHTRDSTAGITMLIRLNDDLGCNYLIIYIHAFLAILVHSILEAVSWGAVLPWK